MINMCIYIYKDVIHNIIWIWFLTYQYLYIYICDCVCLCLLSLHSGLSYPWKIVMFGLIGNHLHMSSSLCLTIFFAMGWCHQPATFAPAPARFCLATRAAREPLSPWGNKAQMREFSCLAKTPKHGLQKHQNQNAWICPDMGIGIPSNPRVYHCISNHWTNPEYQWSLDLCLYPLSFAKLTPWHSQPRYVAGIAA